jgi:transmembrane sensor
MNDWKSYKITWEKLARYFSGNATPEEEEEIKKWVSDDPVRAEIFKMLQEMWDMAGKSDLEVDVEKAWEKVNSRISKTRIRISKTLLGVFALMVLTLTFLFYFLNVRNNNKLTVHEISTGKGQIVTIRLIDGTRIKLNSESLLKVPENYGDFREVYLKGEAYFEVNHLPNSLKFTVRTDKAVVEVLGTKFNVSAYPEDAKVKVVVLDGKVALYPNLNVKEGGVILKRGQMAYVQDGKVGNPRLADLEYELAWIEGGMYFKDRPFVEVVKYLERKYHVRCIVSDSSILKRRFTGSFKSERFEEILSIISLALDLKYNYSDTLVIFDYKQSPRGFNNKNKPRR